MYITATGAVIIAFAIVVTFSKEGEFDEAFEGLRNLILLPFILVALPIMVPYWLIKYWLKGEEIDAYDQNEIEWFERQKGHDPEVDQWADAKIAEIKSKYRLISK